jgi:hypothetical protein
MGQALKRVPFLPGQGWAMGYSLRLRYMQKILTFLPGERSRTQKAIQISAESQGHAVRKREESK